MNLREFEDEKQKNLIESENCGINYYIFVESAHIYQRF